MKNKIKEVHDYFIDKLTKGKFKVKGICEYHIGLLIDDEYLFIIWSCNEDYSIKTIQRYFQCRYDYSFMDLNFSIKNKKTMWSKIKPIIKEYNDTIVLEKKKLQFEQLKKELNK